MNRKTAHEILDNEESTRTRHVRNFIGSHSHTVAEALVIWSQLEDCPPCLRDRLDSLRSELKHLPEFSEPNTKGDSQSPDQQTMKTQETPAEVGIDVQRLVRDAMRYKAIKKRIDYSEGDDGMTWATLNWCVDVHSLSPIDLDEAVDQILLSDNA